MPAAPVHRPPFPACPRPDYWFVYKKEKKRKEEEEEEGKKKKKRKDKNER